MIDVELEEDDPRAAVKEAIRFMKTPEDDSFKVYRENGSAIVVDLLEEIVVKELANG
jgi:hypothetical protein